MIEARTRQVAVEAVDVDGTTVELVAHTSWLALGTSRRGWALAYRRPVEVRRAGSPGTRIVDYVMIVRLTAAFALAALYTFRRLGS